MITIAQAAEAAQTCNQIGLADAAVFIALIAGLVVVAGIFMGRR